MISRGQLLSTKNENMAFIDNLSDEIRFVRRLPTDKGSMKKTIGPGMSPFRSFYFVFR